MPATVGYKGYTIITSLSHGLLAPPKTRLDALSQFSGSSGAFTGAGAVIARFPDPDKTILSVDCTRQALFDDDLPQEDRSYRHMFGNRVMMEVRAYVSKIPPAQVCFRDENEDPGSSESQMKRIAKVFNGLGKPLDPAEIDDLKLALASRP